MGEQLETVRAVTSTVWSIVLGVELASLSDPTEAPMPDGDGFVGSVEITGAYEGTVILECSADLARRAAAGMLGTEIAEVGPEECRDVVAELINIIGGNLKALQAQPSNLSLPTVLVGSERTSGACSALSGSIPDRAWFAWEGLPLSVTLIAGGEAAAATGS